MTILHFSPIDTKIVLTDKECIKPQYDGDAEKYCYKFTAWFSHEYTTNEACGDMELLIEDDNYKLFGESSNDNHFEVCLTTKDFGTIYFYAKINDDRYELNTFINNFCIIQEHSLEYYGQHSLEDFGSNPDYHNVEYEENQLIIKFGIYDNFVYRIYIDRLINNLMYVSTNLTGSEWNEDEEFPNDDITDLSIDVKYETIIISPSSKVSV